MPISKSFKDLSITFDKNPVTNDLLVTKNDAAIKRTIVFCIDLTSVVDDCTCRVV